MDMLYISLCFPTSKIVKTVCKAVSHLPPPSHTSVSVALSDYQQLIYIKSFKFHYWVLVPDSSVCGASTSPRCKTAKVASHQKQILELLRIQNVAITSVLKSLAWKLL